MKAFVITLEGNDYSEHKANECIASGKRFGVTVTKTYGVNKDNADMFMEQAGLKWTWAKNNTANDVCPITGLHQFPYTSATGSLANLSSKKGCSMSHYLLWERCVRLDEPILILEHDAVFISAMPTNPEFNGICMINDPMGATPRAQWWRQQMVRRGGYGAFEKTWIRKPNERNIPDGLAGNSAYMIKPWAAQELIDKYHELGVWPNDATMCKQVFPYLEEYYPFITKVNQTQSTSVK